MGLKHFLGVLSFFAAATAFCQTAVTPQDWKEDAPTPPPAFSQDGLVAINMPRYVTLKIGIDPKTVVVGSDDVVRYVVVMRNASGSVNAAYEGILCATGLVKTYARVSSATGPWVAVEQPEWRSMSDNLPSHHAAAIAKQGACQGHAALGSTGEEIVRALKRVPKSND